MKLHFMKGKNEKSVFIFPSNLAFIINYLWLRIANPTACLNNIANTYHINPHSYSSTSNCYTRTPYSNTNSKSIITHPGRGRPI